MAENGRRVEPQGLTSGIFGICANGWFLFAGKSNMKRKLNELMTAGTVCTFFFGTEYSVGQITQVTQEEFCISNIAFVGTRDGISVYNLASLTKIRWASNFERHISFLANVK